LKFKSIERTESPAGAGEASVPAAAPALTNAMFNLTKKAFVLDRLIWMKFKSNLLFA
jgi:CO/xanthine dehydrogenase Mo-binding subunit